MIPIDENDGIYASDWAAAEATMQRWAKRARESQFSHFQAADHFANRNKRLGIPVVVLSTFVGTTVFATLQKQVDFGVQVLVGAVSVIAAILATLQTFLRLGERAEKHRAVAAKYGAIRRHIEQLYALPLPKRGDIAEAMSGLRTQLDALADAAPDVPSWIWLSVEKSLGANPYEKPKNTRA